MKKKIKGIKKYALAGLTPKVPGKFMSAIGKMGDMSGGALGMLGDIGGLASMFGGSSSATTGGEAAQLSVQDVFKGAGTGAKIGSAFGPVGTVVGGVAGAATGLIGKKGGIDGGSYLEDPTMRLGTGLRGFGNKKIKREFNNRKDAIAQNRFNELIEGQLTANAYEGYDTDINLAQGGMIPESMAYVDDGEVIKTPDGDMLHVPEEGKPTDSNLVSLPGGSKILSDSLKVPGTKETFAQIGKRMMSKKKSNSGDKFALNSEKLNKMNDDMIHEQLYTLLEMSKAKRGITNKFKDGGPVRNIAGAQYRRDKDGNFVPYDGLSIGSMGDINPNANLNNIPSYLNIGFLTAPLYTPQSTKNSTTVSKPKVISSSSTPLATTVRNTTTSIPASLVVPTKSGKVVTKRINKPTQLSAPATTTTASTYNNKIMPKANNTIPELLGSQDAALYNSRRKNRDTNLIGISDEQVTNRLRLTGIQNIKDRQALGLADFNENISKYGNMLGGIGSELAKLAPVFGNMSAKAEGFDTNLNPNRGTIGRLMAGRKYNINPAIEGVKQNRAISNYNAQQMNPNTGANMAYRLQSGINQDRGIMDLYSQKSNMDNQYAGQYAETLNNLGQQYVGAKNLSTDLNARSRAAAGNIRSQGLKQLSDYAQNRELMGNMRGRDMAMLDAYAPFLESIYKKGNYASLMNQYRR